MDIFTVITKDHQQVMTMLDQMMQTDEFSVRRRKLVIQQLQTELSAHMAAEEAIVYPLLKTRREAMDLYDEAKEEHDEAREILDQLMVTNPADASVIETCAELKEALSHHIQVEESEIFEAIRDIARHGKILVELGNQFQDFKEQYFAQQVRRVHRTA